MNKQLMTEAMARADGLIRATQYDGWRTENYTVINDLPDYLTDDNQIDRMVRELDDDQFTDYSEQLCLLMIKDDEDTERPSNEQEIIELLLRSLRATTAQKVEAYLKAIQK